MQEEQVSEQRMNEVAKNKRGIMFDEWKHDIVRAQDLDQVMGVIRAYLASWPYEQLRLLPMDVSGLVVESGDDVIARALLASRAEITAPPSADTTLLREMALTFAAAATRLRWLKTNINARV